MRPQEADVAEAAPPDRLPVSGLCAQTPWLISVFLKTVPFVSLQGP